MTTALLAPLTATDAALIERLAGQPVGRRLAIAGFDLRPDVRQRLLELGLTMGTECRVLRYAPFGDPLQLQVRGYVLSLRAAEATGIRVRPIA
jgi:Fe2+ transport system protein FeoA